jgi:NAD(P)-dependent dehydrogenase (short-subunit alcohol dehydrogenase family)
VEPTELENRVAVATGSGTGIVRAAAAFFAVEGGHSLETGKTARRCRREVRGKSGQIAAVTTDITDPLAVQKLFSEAERLFGKTEILLTCAGVFISGKETKESSEEEWDQPPWIVDGYRACRALPRIRQGLVDFG